MTRPPYRTPRPPSTGYPRTLHTPTPTQRTDPAHAPTPTKINTARRIHPGQHPTPAS